MSSAPATAKDIERAHAQADAYLAEVLRRGEVFSERTRASTRRLFVAVYAQARADHRAEIETALENWAHGATEMGNIVSAETLEKFLEYLRKDDL